MRSPHHSASQPDGPNPGGPKPDGPNPDQKTTGGLPVLGQEEWLEYIPGAVYLTDAQGYLIFFNQAAAELWGRRPEIGVDRWTGAYKVYGSDGSALPMDVNPMAIALKEGRQVPAQEVIIERPDGSRRMILAHPKLIFDPEGRVTGAVNILVDLTDRKRWEKRSQEGQEELKAIRAELEEKMLMDIAAMEIKKSELRQTEERYHRMISEVEDYAILLLDEHGIIQNWNAGAEKIKGYKEKEILGKHFRIFYTLSDREGGLPEKLIAEASSKGKAIHEGWRQRKDGTLFWGSIVITALHDEAGGVIGFSKVTRDLTARRITEEQMRRYSIELEFQNRELQQFAYAAAHDMKEPLRKLRFYNTSALESLKGRLSEKEERFLTRANDAAARMQTLIDDLLTYSQASMDGQVSDWVDLGQILTEACITYQDTIEETGAVIETTDLPVLWGIGFQLRQLLENLVGNALKYRDPKRAPLIRIVGESNCYLPDGAEGVPGTANEYFRITVSDNGIGFEQERAGRIFDIFQRLDNRGKRPGTGIGLAICKRVIQNHRGYIHAKGSPGKGSQFILYLPAGQGSTGMPAEGE